MYRPMCKQNKIPKMTPQFGCISILKTNLPEQALKLMTSWLSQPPEKGPRIYAIISPLPVRRRMQTAVKVAGATAKHCIVIHGDSTFLSGEGRNLDYDQECFTRANVACSRATDLTILACPLNVQGMPGALQVLAALLHGVQTIHTYDSNKEPNIVGSLDLAVTQVEQATTFFQQALLPHPMWCGLLPVCLVEHHHGKVRLTPRLGHNYASNQSRN